MSYNTIDQPPLLQANRDALSRNASSVVSRPKTSSMAAASITKTISNYFFKPEKLPLAIEEKSEFKTISNPFFAKNRKLSQPKNKKSSQVPTGFRNILRAKSTVIKQKKLQQFYISREGRTPDLEAARHFDLGTEKTSSNLFISNFPQKRAKRRNVYSVSLQRKVQPKAITLLEADTRQLPRKVMAMQSQTENLGEMALKEKSIFPGNCPKTAKEQDPLGSKIYWRNLKKKHKFHPLQKQNAQFMISPWGAAADNQDLYF